MNAHPIRFLFAGAATTAVVLGAALASCATAPAPAPTAAAEPPPPPAPDPRLQPPTFDNAATAVTSGDARRDRETAERREILDATWRTVRDKHYDPKLGGLDWDAVRRRYEPRALGAPDAAAFYRTLNDMIGELGQSHMVVSGPGAGDEGEDDAPATAAAAGPTPAAAGAARTRVPPTAPRPGDLGDIGDIGDPGVVVRVIDGRPIVTAVRPGSSGARHGLAPGFVVTAIGGRPLHGAAPHGRPLRPVEERFALRRAALHRLMGPVGSKVTLAFLDNDDRPGQVILERDQPAGPLRQIGYLPPLYPEAHVSELNDVVVISFNVFLLDPLIGVVQRTVDGLAAKHVKGVILDLRGNPGGIGAMAIPVASAFVTAPLTLGSMIMRDTSRTDAVTTFTQTFTAGASLGHVPYTGPLVILTDEGTASASEILAAGLQEAGRARVVGDTSLGAVLPSVVQALPHGAVMQVVVADFKTPKGILLEGRGVQPDQRVVETRAAFRAGRDPVLDAALATIRTIHPR